MRALRRGAVAQRIDQVDQSPVADAMDGIGRDVGGGEAAEGRGKTLTAGQDQLFGPLGALGRVAGGAAGGVENQLAADRIAGQTSDLAGRGAARPGQQEPGCSE